MTTAGDLLPHLSRVVATARRAASCPRIRVAARVQRTGGHYGVSDSALARFETGKVWPQNPDAVIRAYAEALDLDPDHFWAEALTSMQTANGHRRNGANRA
jgi:hypothetical protein